MDGPISELIKSTCNNSTLNKDRLDQEVIISLNEVIRLYWGRVKFISGFSKEEDERKFKINLGYHLFPEDYQDRGIPVIVNDAKIKIQNDLTLEDLQTEMGTIKYEAIVRTRRGQILNLSFTGEDASFLEDQRLEQEFFEWFYNQEEE